MSGASNRAATYGIAEWIAQSLKPIITLTTDFGSSDHYVAAVKGVILGINPDATIVDLSHGVEPQGIEQAAFILSCALPFFPQGSIHVAVVDPELSSELRALELYTDEAASTAHEIEIHKSDV